MSVPHVGAAGEQWSPGPPARVTPAYAAATLRTALQERSPGWDLRRALRAMCDVAHREDLRVEQLLITLKQVWHTLPEARELPSGRERNEILARIISTCIEEYYAVQE